MERRIRRAAHSVFGRYFRGERDRYRSLQRRLVSSRMGVSVDQWLSTSMFVSLLAAVFSVPCLYLLLLVSGTPPVGPTVAAGTVAGITALFGFFFYGRFRPKAEISFRLEDVRYGEGYSLNRLVLALVGVTGAVLVAIAVQHLDASLLIGAIESALAAVERNLVQLFYALVPLASFSATSVAFDLYPRVRSWERGRRIDGLMDSGVSLMGSVAGVGLTPYDSMKFLAEEKAYGEMSEEMNYLARDVDLFGMDLLSALRKLSKETASSRLKPFLQGAVTTITSGGNLREYMTVKSEEYSRETEKELSEYVDSLGLVAEIFLIAGVVAPTLVSVIYAFMAIMGETSIATLYTVILVIPAITFLVTIMADSLEPTSVR